MLAKTILSSMDATYATYLTQAGLDLLQRYKLVMAQSVSRTAENATAIDKANSTLSTEANSD